LEKYAIIGFAKSAIADNYAMLYIFAMLCPANSRSKGLLMRDRNNEDNGVGHPIYSNHWFEPPLKA